MRDNGIPLVKWFGHCIQHRGLLQRIVNKDLKHLLYAFISNELFHNKGSVYVFNKALLDDVSKKIHFKKVHYWSDGAGSQFKNRFYTSSWFWNSINFELFWKCAWNGAVDRVGEAVKSAVWGNFYKTMLAVSQTFSLKHLFAQRMAKWLLMTSVYQ